MKQFEIGKRLICAAALAGALASLSACGGGGGDNGDGTTTGGDGGTTTGSTTGGTTGTSTGSTTGGTTGGSSGGSSGGTSGGVVGSACQQQFSPERAAAGEECTPLYHQFCPEATGGSPVTNDTSVFECDGIVTSSGTVTSGPLTSKYDVVQPSDPTKGTSALYIALHGTFETGITIINRFRLSELAKARDVTVVAPTADTEFKSWGDSPISQFTNPVANRVDLIDQLVTLFQNLDSGGHRFDRVFIVGASGGGEAALEYACAHGDRISGILLDAAAIRPRQVDCAFANSFATVQVHGSSDPVAPYQAQGVFFEGVQPTFQVLYTKNGCASSDLKTVSLNDTLDPNPPITGITVDWVKPCSGKGSGLVTIGGGGHEWPGYDGAIDLDVNLFGAVANGFDTTLQGYDLLTYLGG